MDSVDLTTPRTYVVVSDTPLDTKKNKIFKPTSSFVRFLTGKKYSNQSRTYPQTPEAIAKMMAEEPERKRRRNIESRVRLEKGDTYKHQDFLDEMARINSDQVVGI